jgi:hypothetical protein
VTKEEMLNKRNYVRPVINIKQEKDLKLSIKRRRIDINIMTKIIEKDGYTFKVNINADNLGIQCNVKVKKKFLLFYIWITIYSYDSCMRSVKISSTQAVIQFIQESIDKYIESRNYITEIANYLENWSRK